MQFFGIVYFHKNDYDDESNTMTWMSGTHRLIASLYRLARVPDKDYSSGDDRWRIHDESAFDKVFLAGVYPSKPSIVVDFTTKFLPYLWHHRIYRHTIAIKVGDGNIIHGHLINLHYSYHSEGKGEIDYPDLIFHEI